MAALVLLVLSFTFVNILNDPDCLWHLQTGLLILDNLKLPDADVFSYSGVHDIWINNSWLYDVIVAAVFKTGGFPAMIFLAGFFTSSTIFVVCRYCIVREFGVIATTAAIVAAFSSALVTATLRPHQITILFCVLAFYILSFWRRKLVIATVLATMMIVWVNVHGGYLMMFIIIGSFAAEHLIHRRYADMRNAILLCIIVALATLINPWGIGIYEGVWRTLGSQMNSVIAEWQPLRFSFSQIPVLVIMPVMMIVFGGVLSARNTHAEKIMGFGTLFMALGSVRHISLAGMFCVPLIAAGVMDCILRNKVLMAKELDYSTDMKSRMADKLSRAILMGMLLIIMISAVTFRDYIKIAIHEKYLPEKEVAYLLEKVPDGGLLNDYNLGGNLIFASNGKLKVFIDGRAETVYSAETASDYINMYSADASWRMLMNKYDFTYAVLKKKAPLLKHLLADQNWKVVMETKGNVIMQRQ